jgi:hypothetical protein
VLFLSLCDLIRPNSKRWCTPCQPLNIGYDQSLDVLSDGLSKPWSAARIKYYESICPMSWIVSIFFSRSRSCSDTWLNGCIKTDFQGRVSYFVSSQRPTIYLPMGGRWGISRWYLYETLKIALLMGDWYIQGSKAVAKWVNGDRLRPHHKRIAMS